MPHDDGNCLLLCYDLFDRILSLPYLLPNPIDQGYSFSAQVLHTLMELQMLANLNALALYQRNHK